MLGIEPHFLAGQMRRQARSIALRSVRACLAPLGRKRGFRPCNIRIEVFEAELHLVVIEPFGATAKLAALQLLNNEPQAFDLGLRLREVGAFGRQRPHYLLQRLHIVRQCGKIDVHEPEVYADSRGFSPINMLVSQSAAAIIPPPRVATAAPARANRPRRSTSIAVPTSVPASRPARRSMARGTHLVRAAW